MVTKPNLRADECNEMMMMTGQGNNNAWFEYFLNSSNHLPGAPAAEAIDYHYYAQPSSRCAAPPLSSPPLPSPLLSYYEPYLPDLPDLPDLPTCLSVLRLDDGLCVLGLTGSIVSLCLVSFFLSCSLAWLVATRTDVSTYAAMFDLVEPFLQYVKEVPT